MQVCQFASIDISDMMGTERQGITKDITMTRLNSDGESLGVIDYTDDSLTYEEVADTSEEELPCSVTLYEHDEFTGWEAVFGPGEYDHAKLVEKGATNDDVESIVVSKGCSAVIAQHGQPNVLCCSSCFRVASRMLCCCRVSRLVAYDTVAVVVDYMIGEHDGWEATLTDSGGSKGDGRYEQVVWTAYS